MLKVESKNKELFRYFNAVKHFSLCRYNITLSGLIIEDTIYNKVYKLVVDKSKLYLQEVKK